MCSQAQTQTQTQEAGADAGSWLPLERLLAAFGAFATATSLSIRTFRPAGQTRPKTGQGQDRTRPRQDKTKTSTSTSTRPDRTGRDALREMVQHSIAQYSTVQYDDAGRSESCASTAYSWVWIASLRRGTVRTSTVQYSTAVELASVAEGNLVTAAYAFNKCVSVCARPR